MCYDKFNLRKLLALLPYCDYLISVDSFLAHAGYGISIPGTQFMGGTSSVNFGYPHYYHTVQRKGFPKTYVAFRMAGVVEKNQDAMKFTDEELVVAVNEIKNRLKNEPDSCGKCSCQNVKKPRKITCLK